MSRALREQAAANAHGTERGEFTGMLLAALEDPRVQEAVEVMMLRRAAERARRNSRSTGLTVSSVAEAKALKESRLAARGGQRG